MSRPAVPGSRGEVSVDIPGAALTMGLRNGRLGATMLKRILVGVTGTQAFAAKVDFVLDLAERHGAEIGAVSCIDVDRLANVGPVPIGAGAFAEELVEHRLKRAHACDEEAMRRLAEAGAARGVKVARFEREGDPRDILAKLHRYHDILCLSLHGWFDDAVIPEPEDALLEVLAGGVRPILAVAEEPRPVDKVLIAYDGSPQAAKAMRQYAQLRPWGDASVEVACAGDGATEETAETLLADARAYCAAHGLAVTTAHLDEDSPEVLLDHARAIGAGLIVMGVSQRRLLIARRFGPHTSAILRNARVPLFLSH
jgi:nucleotide-binding universal stress UspA family protein